MNSKKYLYIIILILFSWSSIKTLPTFASASQHSLQIVYTSTKTSTGEDFYGEYDGEDSVNKAYESLRKILEEGQVVFNGLIGLGILSSVAAFVFTSYKLGQSGDSKARAEAIKTLISISIVTACLGGFPMIYSLVISSIF